MTYDELAEIALAMPEVEEGMSYGAPSMKRAGRFMFAPKKDGETISVKLDWATHDRLLEDHPDMFFKTPHYEGWPGFLARLSVLTPAVAKELVEASWRDAPMPGSKRKT